MDRPHCYRDGAPTTVVRNPIAPPDATSSALHPS